MVVNVNVKWGKQTFKNIQVNTDSPPILFKSQLCSLSSVNPDRQKILLKGKTLGDEDWVNFPALKDGMTLMMMGSVDESIPVLLNSGDVASEAVSNGGSSQAANALIPPGLKNMGNTCYMAATLQCLKSVPELCSQLDEFTGGSDSASGGGPNSAITRTMKTLYESMRTTKDASVTPLIFLSVLHSTFPQLATKGDHGELQQQDANECWTELFSSLKRDLPNDFMRKYFGIATHSVVHCVDNADEAKSEADDTFFQMSCFINTEIKYLFSGLQASLKEKLTKFSSALNRDAAYERNGVITRLPAYISIQFVRFFYKEKEKVNAKILKDVKYPATLDMFELCGNDLKTRLQPMREQVKNYEEWQIEQDKIRRGLDKRGRLLATGKSIPFSFEDDPGSNNSGLYQLQAVLTHKGRTSNSGHYVAWIRFRNDGWLMFDDEDVSTVTEEEVLKLSGGGDWHTAYVLLYGPKRIFEIPKEPMES